MELLTAETPKPRSYDQQDRRGSARKRRAPAILCDIDVKSALSPALSGKRRRVPITVARKPRRTTAGNAAGLALKKVSAASNSRSNNACETALLNSAAAGVSSDEESSSDRGNAAAVASGDEESNAAGRLGNCSGYHRLSHASRKLWKRRSARRGSATMTGDTEAITPDSSTAESKTQLVRRRLATPTHHIEFDSEDSTEEDFVPANCCPALAHKKAVLAFPVPATGGRNLPRQQHNQRDSQGFCEEVSLAEAATLSTEEEEEEAAAQQLGTSLLDATKTSPPGTPREEVLPRAPASPGQCPLAPKRQRRSHLSLGRALMANVRAQVRAAAEVEEVNSPVWVRNAENGRYTLELPLLYAAANCSAAVLGALLEAGAEPAAVDSRGLTSLDLLEKRHREAPARSAMLTRAECATAISTLIRYSGLDGRRRLIDCDAAAGAAALPDSFIDDENVEQEATHGDDGSNGCNSADDSQMMFLLPFTPCA